AGQRHDAVLGDVHVDVREERLGLACELAVDGLLDLSRASHVRLLLEPTVGPEMLRSPPRRWPAHPERPIRVCPPQPSGEPRTLRPGIVGRGERNLLGQGAMKHLDEKIQWSILAGGTAMLAMLVARKGLEGGW